MPTQPYFNEEGKRLGGVTYVIGQNCGWNKDALMAWSNREGLAGRNIKDSREKRSTAGIAADIGTAAHSMIEAHILGFEPEVFAADHLAVLTEEQQDKARNGFGAFVRWFRNQRVRIVATELYGVDEEYQTGYCLDALGIEVESDTFSLYDWKSSKGTYADHFVQAAAYTVFEERRLTRWLDKPVRFEGAHVVRVNKLNGNFKHVFWTRESLEVGWKAFTWLRALHEVRWEIEAAVR